mmetsp:Transcript_20167/g.30197  ORF Transcript_20167/g.30197 Transcript_20167/m.30197 type:complete len:81 (-) Transcript_20167:405-647(-)
MNSSQSEWGYRGGWKRGLEQPLSAQTTVVQPDNHCTAVIATLAPRQHQVRAATRINKLLSCPCHGMPSFEARSDDIHCLL